MNISLADLKGRSDSPPSSPSSARGPTDPAPDAAVPPEPLADDEIDDTVSVMPDCHDNAPDAVFDGVDVDAVLQNEDFAAIMEVLQVLGAPP